MFTKKNDPLIESVKLVMQESDIHRKIESLVNEHFGVVSRKALPHELHGEYDAVLSEAKKLVGHQNELDVAPPYGRLTGADFRALRKGKRKDVEEDAQTPLGPKGSKFIKNDPNVPKALEEKITKKTSAGEVISDFVHSDNPKFKGKSRNERMRMALGAYYGKHPEKSKKTTEESVDDLMEEIRLNLEHKLAYAYDNLNESDFADYVNSLSEEELSILGLISEGPFGGAFDTPSYDPIERRYKGETGMYGRGDSSSGRIPTRANAPSRPNVPSRPNPSAASQSSSAAPAVKPAAPAVKPAAPVTPDTGAADKMIIKNGVLYNTAYYKNGKFSPPAAKPSIDNSLSAAEAPKTNATTSTYGPGQGAISGNAGRDSEDTGGGRLLGGSSRLGGISGRKIDQNAVKTSSQTSAVDAASRGGAYPGGGISGRKSDQNAVTDPEKTVPEKTPAQSAAVDAAARGGAATGGAITQDLQKAPAKQSGYSSTDFFPKGSFDRTAYDSVMNEASEIQKRGLRNAAQRIAAKKQREIADYKASEKQAAQATDENPESRGRKKPIDEARRPKKPEGMSKKRREEILAAQRDAAEGMGNTFSKLRANLQKIKDDFNKNLSDHGYDEQGRKKPVIKESLESFIRNRFLKG